MKALSLTQPWATFVARGYKPVENRRQYFAEIISGEPFAIHASLTWDEEAAVRIARAAAGDDELLSVLHGEHVRGAILAVASSTSYLQGAEGTLASAPQPVHRFADRTGPGRLCTDPALLRWYFAPQYGYVLDRVTQIDKPIECKGALGFWRLPSEVGELITTAGGAAWNR